MRFIWPDSARSDMRGSALRSPLPDSPNAVSGKGTSGFELERRIILAIGPEEITVVRVRHRSEVYR